MAVYCSEGLRLGHGYASIGIHEGVRRHATRGANAPCDPPDHSVVGKCSEHSVVPGLRVPDKVLIAIGIAAIDSVLAVLVGVQFDNKVINWVRWL
jgi:hypothetical protein